LAEWLKQGSAAAKSETALRYAASFLGDRCLSNGQPLMFVANIVVNQALPYTVILSNLSGLDILSDGRTVTGLEITEIWGAK
jgi:hypothetical protein